MNDKLWRQVVAYVLMSSA